MKNLKYCIYYLDTKILLKPEKTYSIGRDKSNEIKLPGFATSRKHARLLWQDEHFVIEDAKSTNGLFVNGQKCDKHVLFDGDHINIGTFYLVYKEYDPKRADPSDLDYALSDTLIIEHQIAELLKSISDRKIQEKLINLKMYINKFKNKLDKLANRDRLTRLYNRRYFDEEFIKELERSARYKYSLSLFMIDLDDFKKINDAFGHQKGDHVLSAAASIISENTRLNDLVARYGGEEIVVVIPEIDPNNAVLIAEKIRGCIEKESAKRIGIKLTASIGGAFKTAEDSGESLISKADNALYEAKKRGKNRVVII
jgi:diguanylate cyclase (GGDEF)-like protein